MPHIVVMSADADFAEPLAEQIRLRLKLECRVGMEAAGAALAVVTEPVKAECPVLVVSHKKLKMQALLDDIQQALLRPDEMVPLGGGYVLKLRQKQLCQTGNEIDLTDKEIQLLQVLADAKGGVVSKEHLLKHVWGIDSALDTHTLETHIYRLRGKFRELSGEDAIAAMDGGYALTVE
jgi:hypothetical protein